MLTRFSYGICIKLFILSIIWITPSYSIEDDGPTVNEGEINYGDLECILRCYNKEKKKCVTPSGPCGGCVETHVSVDGVCRPRTMAVAEAVPNVKRQLEEAVVKHKRKLEEESRAESGVGGGMGGGSLDLKSRDGGVNDSNQSNVIVIDDAVFIGVIAAFVSAAVIGIIVAIICYCKMRRSAKDVSDRDFSSYGSSLVGGKGTGPDSYPTKPPTVDRKLAQSAQMFHYQHQKQQMLELERAQEVASKSDEEMTSEDDNGDDQYTVYECPGLATTGEMEVRNPLYMEDSPLPPPYTPSPPPPFNPDSNPPPSSAHNGYSEK